MDSRLRETIGYYAKFEYSCEIISIFVQDQWRKREETITQIRAIVDHRSIWKLRQNCQNFTRNFEYTSRRLQIANNMWFRTVQIQNIFKRPSPAISWSFQTQKTHDIFHDGGNATVPRIYVFFKLSIPSSSEYLNANKLILIYDIYRSTIIRMFISSGDLRSMTIPLNLNVRVFF